MDLIGSKLIATPEKLGMPKDFYYRADARYLPGPTEDTHIKMKKRFFMTRFRRELGYAAARIAGATCSVMLFVLAVLTVIYQLLSVQGAI
jgi:hypothetical protein